jgi:uncharacterized protein YbaR (Trm112 family)
VGEGSRQLAQESRQSLEIRLSTRNWKKQMSLSPRLLEILVCPKCKSELEYRESEQALLCPKCRLRYAVRDDIPIMLIDEATPY